MGGRWNKSSLSPSGMTHVLSSEFTKQSSPQTSATDEVDLGRQDDEILTISAMYPECFVQEDPAAVPREFEVTLAACPLCVTLPAGYPMCEPPQFSIIHRENGVSRGLFVARQGAAQDAQAFLRTHIFSEGEECLFAALEDLGNRLQLATDEAGLRQKSNVAISKVAAAPPLECASNPLERDEGFVCLLHLRQGNDEKEKPLPKLLQHIGLDAVVFYGRPCLLHIQGAPEDVDAFVGQCNSSKITISISLAQRLKGPVIASGVVAVPAKKESLDGAALKTHLEKRCLGETSFSIIGNSVPKGSC